MNSNKYIFLDIDGVMATQAEWSTKKTSKRYLKEFDVYPFNEKCVKVLNKILKKTKAEIILSSDWSLYFTLEQMDEIFKINGIIKSPIDYVKQLALKMSMDSNTNRGYSIDEYLAYHPEVQNYVIVDDLVITLYNERWTDNLTIDYSRFVHCSRGDFEGIKQTGIKEKILKILL
jgi:hypothetical protein